MKDRQHVQYVFGTEDYQILFSSSAVKKCVIAKAQLQQSHNQVIVRLLPPWELVTYPFFAPAYTGYGLLGLT